MKTIIRNFLSVIRCFKTATLLNILGLSVAFTAMIVIMMQVTYDLEFDHNQPEADNIYRIETTIEGRNIAVVPRPFVEGLKASSPHIKATAFSSAIISDMYDLLYWVETENEKQHYSGKLMTVSESFPDVFQFNMVEGLADLIREPQHVLIPGSMAKKLFGDESAVHKYLINENLKMIVGGVYKDFPENSSTKNVIYIEEPDGNKDNWSDFNYEGYVLVHSSVQMDELLDRYMKNLDPEVYNELKEKGTTFKAVPLKQVHFNMDVEFDSIVKVSRQTIWVLMAIAFVILLIAAINFTNYSIALTPLRIRSINTQKVLGASENRLRSSILVEAVLTCFLAWIVALLFTHLLSLTSVSQIVSPDMALNQHEGLLVGMGLLALAVGAFAGIYPAFYVTSFTPALVLKGSFGLSPKGRQLRNSLIGIQFIASFILIVVSLFMYLQIQFMHHASLGFDKDQIIVTNLNRQITNAGETFANELKANPNIETISYAESLLAGFDTYSLLSREYKGETKDFQMMAVDTGFLRTMGIDLLDGRDFVSSDMESDHIVFLFNEKARNEFGLSLGDKMEEGEEIIGFIPNINLTSLRKEIEPMAFMYAHPNFSGGRQWAYIRVKANSDLSETIHFIENTLQKLSPGFPFNVRIYDNILNNLYIKENNLTTMVIWFSLIAVLISMVGVFGLVVFESEYKRKEIGVRKVLGSSATEILAMFNMRYIRISAVCFVLAAPIAWYAISLWLENFAYRTPLYWWVFLLSFVLITAITIATVTFQSWNVANDNPVDSIKTE